MTPICTMRPISAIRNDTALKILNAPIFIPSLLGCNTSPAVFEQLVTNTKLSENYNIFINIGAKSIDK